MATKYNPTTGLVEVYTPGFGAGDDGSGSGEPGPPGPTGPQGPQGEPGNAGSTGPQGDPGSDGSDGADGADGAPGVAGASGATGAKGDTGNTGATGSTGPTGATGSTGAKGDQGDPGADGQDGAQGPAGAAGPGFSAGGTTAQVVRKASNVDYDFEYHTPVKADVGLASVDNTSDASKPVSTAQQTALDAKVDKTTTVNGHALSGNISVTKSDVSLGSVDNTSDVNKPVSTAQQSALDLKEALANKATDFSVLNNTKYPTTQAVDIAIKAQVAGLWDDRGNFDASVNTFPAGGGSGTAGAILKGDIWTVSVAGTLGGAAVNQGDTVRALVDTPGQTAGNWAIHEANLGYTPENVINKDTDVALTANSDIKYPSQKAVKAFVAAAIAAATPATQRTFSFFMG